MSKKKIKFEFVLFFIVLFVLFAITSIIVTSQSIKHNFNGIIIDKKYVPPSAMFFYIENESGKQKKESNGMTFYNGIMIGDSVVKRKGDSYIYIYRKENAEYKFHQKFEY